MKKEIYLLIIMSLVVIGCSIFTPTVICGAPDIATIDDIKVELAGYSPEIKIASNIPIEYLDYTLESPPRIIVDPLGTVYTNLDERIFSDDNSVRSVSLIKAPGSVPHELGSNYYPLDFIVIELKKSLSYKISREDKLVVRLGEEITAQSVPKAAKAASPRVEVVEEEAVEERPAEVEEAIQEVIAKKAEPKVGEEFFDEEKFPLIEKYKIEAGDELEISIWQHPELMRKIVVRPDGFISFPLAGEVMASGMTAEEVAKAVTLRVGKTIRKPEVSVILTGCGSKGIFVLGAVGKPGLYPYNSKTTALKAISAAEGWQPQAYLSSVLVVKRGFSQDAEVMRVNLWDVIKYGDVKKDVEINAGDIVYVPQSFIGNLGTFMDGLRFRFSTGAHYTLSD